MLFYFFFFNDTATTEIYTLSLHDALPILIPRRCLVHLVEKREAHKRKPERAGLDREQRRRDQPEHRRHDRQDRKSTRLNSSHANISYAVFCLKKKKNTHANLSSTLHDE